MINFQYFPSNRYDELLLFLLSKFEGNFDTVTYPLNKQDRGSIKITGTFLVAAREL